MPQSAASHLLLVNSTQQTLPPLTLDEIRDQINEFVIQQILALSEKVPDIYTAICLVLLATVALLIMWFVIRDAKTKRPIENPRRRS
jgi:hypothetical protein